MNFDGFLLLDAAHRYLIRQFHRLDARDEILGNLAARELLLKLQSQLLDDVEAAA